MLVIILWLFRFMAAGLVEVTVLLSKCKSLVASLTSEKRVVELSPPMFVVNNDCTLLCDCSLPILLVSTEEKLGEDLPSWFVNSVSSRLGEDVRMDFCIRSKSSRLFPLSCQTGFDWILLGEKIVAEGCWINVWLELCNIKLGYDWLFFWPEFD